MDRRPISAVDSLWLQMDTPENLMVIDSVMMLDGPLDVERVGRILQRRLADRYPVFRQIPLHSVNPLLGLNWVDDPDFDVHRHIIEVTLPAPGDEIALQHYVEDQMSVPLDRTRPLWQVHVINGYGEGSAVVCRFHHALADGTALARVLLDLTDAGPTDDLDEALLPAVREPLTHVSGLNALMQGAVEAVADTVSAVTAVADRGVRGGLTLLGQLPHLRDPHSVVDFLHLVNDSAGVAGKLLFSQNPPTVVIGKAGVTKRAVWSQPIPLATLRTAAHAHGVTVNDLMITALSGALREHLDFYGDPPGDLGTMVPVNLRPLDQPLPRELGNKFALVLLRLPVGGTDIRARLAMTKERMDEIKAGPEAVLTFGLLESLGAINQQLAHAAVEFFSTKAVGVTTNVAGPPKARWLAGAEVTGVLGWVPGAGDQTLGSCIFSFNGTIRVGFKADRKVIPGPERLVSAFETELDALLALKPA